MQDKNGECIIHSKEVKDRVCLTCNQPICSNCASDNHKEHKIGNFKEGLEKLIADTKTDIPSLETSIGILRENKKIVLELVVGKLEKLRIMKQKTEANFQEVIDMLSRKKEEVSGIISNKIQELDEEKKDIEMSDTHLKAIIEACKGGVDEESYTKLLKNIESIRKLKRFVDKLPSMNMEVEMSKSYPAVSLQEFITLTGSIQLPNDISNKKAERISFESNIVKLKEDQELLGRWIEEASGSTFKLQLLWRGTTDGFRASTFHSKCDDKGPTLTIILSNKDCIFGGYSSKSWKSSGGFVSDEKAFIYSLTHKTKHAKQKSEDYSIYCRGNYGPTFGSGNDIHIIDKCNTSDKNYSNGNHTYELPAGVEVRTYFAGIVNFKVKEIEVYSVII